MVKHSEIASFFLALAAAMAATGCGLAKVDAKIGGTVSGLSVGATVSLVNNGTDQITVGTAGSFYFDVLIAAGATYNVTVATNPTGEICTVTNGSGTVDQNGDSVTGVTVNCVAGGNAVNAVYGTVTGLASGVSVSLLDNGGDPLTVSANGSFVFPTALAPGSTYSVTVSSGPAGKNCTVANPTGVVPASGISTNVIVSC